MAMWLIGDGGRLRQQDRDPIALPDAARAQHVGQSVRGFVQRAIADLLHPPPACTWRMAVRPGSVSAQRSQTSTPIL